MNKRTVSVYLLFLCAGGGIAWLVPARVQKSMASHVGRTLRHVQENQEVLARGSPLFDAIQGFVQGVEDGSAHISTVIEISTRLLANLQPELSASAEGLTLQLVQDGETFGHLRKTGPDDNGLTSWVFNIALPPLPRYGDLADHTQLSIAYRGVSGTFAHVAALTQTFVHYREATIAAMGSEPLVVGGCLEADASSSFWHVLSLEVAFPEDVHVPQWTARTAKTEPREDALGTVSSESVAAVLFSL